MNSDHQDTPTSAEITAVVGTGTRAWAVEHLSDMFASQVAYNRVDCRPRPERR